MCVLPHGEKTEATSRLPEASYPVLEACSWLWLWRKWFHHWCGEWSLSQQYNTWFWAGRNWWSTWSSGVRKNSPDERGWAQRTLKANNFYLFFFLLVASPEWCNCIELATLAQDRSFWAVKPTQNELGLSELPHTDCYSVPLNQFMLLALGFVYALGSCICKM